MTPEQYETLAAKYLAALAAQDMKHWREHMRTLERGATHGKRDLCGIAPINPRRLRPITGVMCAVERPDVFNKPRRGAERAKACEQFIVKRLAAGPVFGLDVIATGKARGFTFDMLRNARRRLGVTLDGNGRAAVWSLPSNG